MYNLCYFFNKCAGYDYFAAFEDQIIEYGKLISIILIEF